MKNEEKHCNNCADHNPKQTSFSKYLSIIRVVLVGLLLLLSWLAGFFDWQLSFIPPHWQYLEDFFAALAIVIGWWPILKNAVRTVLSKNLNVNVLVSIAVTAALFVGAHKEAAIVVFIMLLGEFLENFTVGKTSQAVKKLMELAPQKARVRRDGKEMVIPIKEVEVGDVVIVKPGEQVGVDGLLLSKDAQLDQSVITGESMSVNKSKGEKILAGSISDGYYFEIKATQVGENTTLAQIQKLVKEAQASKAPVQSLVDKIAKYFVPGVLFAALAIGFVTSDISRAITILIVACPCAFIVATPVSMVAGIGRGAKRGILIKGGQYLESLGKIDKVIFDKTGTLTLGEPEVLEVKKFGSHTEKEIIKIAAVLESRSEHHLAEAILEKAEELDIGMKEPEKIEIVKGKGIIGRFNQNSFYLGNPALMRENNIDLPQNVISYIQTEEQKNHTVVVIAHDRQACGAICLTDKLRKEAKETIENLRKLGIKEVSMLTGDNENVARGIAKDLEIDNFFAEMLPQDKIDQIKKFQEGGKKVIMVGDGINDAPALAQADIGIAMGSGTNIALESGNIALMKNELIKIPEAVKLGRKTLSVIKQNLTFAIGFNFLMFILAGLAIINMIGGAVFHQVSSLAVILNAMRILVVR